MSFLTTRTFPAIRAARSFTYAPAARLAFTTTALRNKTATETVKDTLKTVDRAVSDKLVDGIEMGTVAAEKVKESVGATTAEVRGKAEELKGSTQGKAAEMKGQAMGKAAEMKGQVKGAAAEAKGKM